MSDAIVKMRDKDTPLLDPFPPAAEPESGMYHPQRARILSEDPYSPRVRAVLLYKVVVCRQPVATRLVLFGYGRYIEWIGVGQGCRDCKAVRERVLPGSQKGGGGLKTRAGCARMRFCPGQGGYMDEESERQWPHPKLSTRRHSTLDGISRASPLPSSLPFFNSYSHLVLSLAFIAKEIRGKAV